MQPTTTRLPTLRHDVVPHLARSAFKLAVAVALAALLSGCGCRPGYVGPYGGVHPPRCWI